MKNVTQYKNVVEKYNNGSSFAYKQKRISKEEFSAGIEVVNQLLDKPLSQHDISKLFSVIDKDNSGTISYEEFISSFLP